MRSKEVEAAINNQMAKEFYAAHLYLAMAAYFETESLSGFAKWMRMQHEEELVHAMKLYDYLIQTGGQVALQGVDQPPTSFKSPIEVMRQSLEHERTVSASINALYELATAQKDYPTQLALQWFISEQVEEERIFTDVIARLELAGDSGAALLLLDSELGGRGPEPEAE